MNVQIEKIMLKIKIKSEKPRNFVAKDLMSAKYRQRKQISSVKVYSRAAEKRKNVEII